MATNNLLTLNIKQLKTVTFKQKKNLGTLRWLFFSFIVLAVHPINAQFQNNGSLFINDNAYVYIGNTAFNFGSGSGQTVTTRTATQGSLIFSSASTTTGATNTHYLDGYASLRTTADFLLPTGQSGVYAPARITPVTTAAIDAAYFKQSTATIGSTLDATLNLLSSSEYWNIQGSNSARIALTWRPSSALTNLTDLTIAGYDGAKWVEIPSAVDATSILGTASSLNSGSISSAATVDLTAYKYFTFAVKDRTLANPYFDAKNILAYINRQMLKISTSIPMTNVTIYDIKGSLVTEISINNQLELANPFEFAQGIYIVKIKMNNGTIASQKLINN